MGILEFSFIIWQPGYRVGGVYSERIFLKSTRTCRRVLGQNLLQERLALELSNGHVLESARYLAKLKKICLE